MALPALPLREILATPKHVRLVDRPDPGPQEVYGDVDPAVNGADILADYWQAKSDRWQQYAIDSEERHYQSETDFAAEVTARLRPALAE